MATWPATLPAPLQSGYALKPVDQLVRTDMEGGSARVRRVTTVRNDTVSLGWKLTDAQLLIFRNWFDDAVTGIDGGANWFTGLSLAVGNGIQTTLECRFVGPFDAAMMDGSIRWQVTAKVEVR